MILKAKMSLGERAESDLECLHMFIKSYEEYWESWVLDFNFGPD